jgi:hypothetical protein
MTFLTYNLKWSTIVELYLCRWEIGIFFNQTNQTLKPCDLMSSSANGISVAGVDCAIDAIDGALLGMVEAVER